MPSVAALLLGDAVDLLVGAQKACSEVALAEQRLARQRPPLRSRLLAAHAVDDREEAEVGRHTKASSLPLATGRGRVRAAAHEARAASSGRSARVPRSRCADRSRARSRRSTRERHLAVGQRDLGGEVVDRRSGRRPGPGGPFTSTGFASESRPMRAPSSSASIQSWRLLILLLAPVEGHEAGRGRAGAGRPSTTRLPARIMVAPPVHGPCRRSSAAVRRGAASSPARAG